MTQSTSVPHIHRLVPFAHVADVEASMAFYALLGFEEASRHRGPAGRTVWAHLKRDAAELMLAQASGPIDADQQAVLFYMYTDRLELLRSHLLAHGVHDGGEYCGAPVPATGGGVVYGIQRPFYMEHGELRVIDRDGYVLLIGQLI